MTAAEEHKTDEGTPPRSMKKDCKGVVPGIDVLPTLEDMPSVVWEQALSFLPPAGISTMSHRISKTLGAGEDKVESPEKAAKLALENMMSVAWTKAKKTYDGVAANDDYIDRDCEGEELKKISKFEDESFLRTYMLAATMFRWGERKKDEIEGSGRLVLMDTDKDCPLYITMFLIYGRPPLPPLTEAGATVALATATGLDDLIGTPFHKDGTGWVDTKEQRLKTKDTLEKFCRLRILAVAERLGKVGIYPDASMLTTLLAFGRPHMCIVNKHIYQAEYPVDARVVLKGLSSTALNGKVGVVEKEYVMTRQKNGRIGVALVDENTGDRRVVGIKPSNLERVDEDPTFVIDAKILNAKILVQGIQTRKDWRPQWMPGVVHSLRGVVSKLRDKVEASENDESLIGENIHGDNSHYPSDIHRLFYAEAYLGFLIATIARYVAMGLVEREFGGLTCRNYDQVLALGRYQDNFANSDEMIMTQVVAIAQYYLGEAAGALVNCEKSLRLIRKEEVGGENGPLLLFKSLIDGTLHDTAGFLSGALNCAFIPLNHRLSETLRGGEHAERTAREHVMVAVACMRSEVESLLDAYSVGSRSVSKPFDVNIVCSNVVLPQSFACNLAHLSYFTAEIYANAKAFWGDVDIFPDDECEDMKILIKLALVVSIRTIGQYHPLTKKIGMSYDRILGNSRFEEGCTRFYDVEASVEDWLKCYSPSYFETDREHPALFNQLTRG